jgi:hypothetical protein
MAGTALSMMAAKLELICSSTSSISAVMLPELSITNTMSTGWFTSVASDESCTQAASPPAPPPPDWKPPP